MTIGRSQTAIPYAPGLVGDVVAGLANDGRAEGIARVAVDEARRRGARLRFLQVVREDLSPHERADADQATFRAAVRALRGFRGIPCRFELVTGDPTPTLLELARSASVIIVGDGGPWGPTAERCRADCDCPVIAVSLAS
jgi:nucleotide-binding universal stress UspA family protein